MAELVDAHDSKSCGAIHESSILSLGTKMKKKVLVILGPTASGKSDLAVSLALRFGGEIVSADSRQVYKYLNSGTGKITRAEMRGIKHHLLDVVEPRKRFTVSEFVSKANEALKLIEANEALPIVVGGTGFYIDALSGRESFPDVPPDKLLRRKLDKLSKEKLFKILEKKDPRRASTIDPHNKVRLIRALEIIASLGSVPEPSQTSTPSPYSFVYIGINPENLDERIEKRLEKRMPGMIREARRLIKEKKLTYKRMHELGLEYRYLALYLQGKMSKADMTEKLYTEIRRYAKRQMAWFKRNKKIQWFKSGDNKGIEKYLRGMLG